MARPDMQPDPRIGIGQCFWNLKMKSDARAAWERALELVRHAKTGTNRRNQTARPRVFFLQCGTSMQRFRVST